MLTKIIFSELFYYILIFSSSSSSYCVFFCWSVQILYNVQNIHSVIVKRIIFLFYSMIAATISETGIFELLHSFTSCFKSSRSAHACGHTSIPTDSTL